jgi:DNA polymerase-3 subunit alpha
LDRYRAQVEAMATHPFSQMSEAKDGAFIRAPGIITSVKRILTKKAKPMAFVTLEDFTGSIEVIVFTEVLESAGKLIQEDKMVVVAGKVSTRENEVAKLIAEEVVPLSSVVDRFYGNLMLELEAEEMNSDLMDKLEEIFDQYPGSAQVFFRVKVNSGDSFNVQSKKYRVSPDTQLMESLNNLLGNTRVKMLS